MPRARNIKPSFFTNEQLAEVSIHARLLFIGLWCLADREGRLEDRPRRIKMQVFPADSIDVDALLGELAHAGLLVRYDAEGMNLLWIPAFKKHQKPHHKEAESELPAYECSKNPVKVRASTNLGACEPSLNPESPLLNASSTKKGARKRAAFVPPTLNEVAEYTQARGSPVDPEAFVAFYESKGWKVGKEPMKSWKAAIVTWEKRQHEKPSGSGGRVFESGAEARRRQLEEQLAAAEGVEAADGNVRGQILEGVWERAE